MKNLYTIAFLLLVANTAFSQIQEVNIDEGFVLYKTAKEGEIEVPFYLRDTDKSQVVMDDLMTMLTYTNSAIKVTLKSQRSFIPLSYTYKVKPNRSGKPKKQKYSVILSYEATNSYGGAVEDIASIEFNAKLRETAGSVMLRMN